MLNKQTHTNYDNTIEICFNTKSRYIKDITEISTPHRKFIAIQLSYKCGCNESVNCNKI